MFQLRHCGTSSPKTGLPGVDSSTWSLRVGLSESDWRCLASQKWHIFFVNQKAQVKCVLGIWVPNKFHKSPKIAAEAYDGVVLFRLVVGQGELQGARGRLQPPEVSKRVVCQKKM